MLFIDRLVCLSCLLFDSGLALANKNDIVIRRGIKSQGACRLRRSWSERHSVTVFCGIEMRPQTVHEVPDVLKPGTHGRETECGLFGSTTGSFTVVKVKPNL